jgi:Domain of unknown function (DUF1905)
MKFRTYVEPPEPMRGLEVPAEVVESLAQGKRPRVTITINGHSWKSRVAIMRGRYLLGLSNANRQAAGVVTGDEVEVELEFDPEPRLVAEPADFARALSADPVARTAYDRLPKRSQTGARTRYRELQRSPRRGDGGSRRHWPRCGTWSRQGAPPPAGGPEPRSRCPTRPELDDPSWRTAMVRRVDGSSRRGLSESSRCC